MSRKASVKDAAGRRIDKELEALADGAIVIGHSLGASFLLKYLSEEIVGKIIAGLFLIATPYWGGRGWRYEGYERVALREDFAAKLPRGTPVYLYHGRDDEIVPFAHLDELQKLPIDAAHEMMVLTQRMETVLRSLYRPDGINLGMNIGKAAGAGVVGHIHMHILPRWTADANFVSVIGETRILPETLDMTWERIRKALQSP